MASVPHLPTAPVVPQPGVLGIPESDGLPVDFFAQLLGGGPLVVSVTGPGAEAPASEIAVRAAPGSDGESDTGETISQGPAAADIIPLLQAQSGFPVVVVPAAPVPGVSVPIGSATAQAANPQPASAALPPSSQSDTAPAVQIVAAAVKAAVDKPVGKPLSWPDKPGRATLALPESDMADNRPAIEPTLRLAAKGQGMDTAVQPASPPAVAGPAAPLAPAFASPSAVPQTIAGADPAPQALPVAEIVIERQLDLANDSRWLDRLARDIARAGAGDEPLRFRLHPQTLGHLHVELTQTERGASVRLTVETEAARNILIDAQPRLAAEARAQGVRLAGTEVDLGTAGQQGDARRDAEAPPRDVVRVVRAGPTDSTSSDAARSRSDRYA